MEFLEPRQVAVGCLSVVVRDVQHIGDVRAVGAKLHFPRPGTLKAVRGIRVPLIVRWPGKVAPASICQVPVTSPDLFATILDLAGAAAPVGQAIDGVSLVPLLRQTGGIARDSLYWHFPTSMWSRWPGGAIRKGRFKLIEFLEDDRVELYDLEADLGETHNLAAEHSELANQLRGELQRWRRSIGAAMPAPNPDYDAARADLLPDPPMIPTKPVRSKKP